MTNQIEEEHEVIYRLFDRLVEDDEDLLIDITRLVTKAGWFIAFPPMPLKNLAYVMNTYFKEREKDSDDEVSLTSAQAEELEGLKLVCRQEEIAAMFVQHKMGMRTGIDTVLRDLSSHVFMRALYTGYRTCDLTFK